MAHNSVIYKQLIGEGTFGEVYKAEYEGTIVAAKKVHQRFFQNETVLRKFYAECQILQRLNHINIVRYIDTVRDPDTQLPVLLIELMSESLTKYLQDCKEPIAYHFQVNMCCQIASALSYLHWHGIMHRDLSSNNVLVSGEHVKISDFGTAKLQDILGPHTRCPGTEAYMPPEALNQPALYTTSIDCYSFGILTIQIDTRQVPSILKETVDSAELQLQVTIPKNFTNIRDFRNPLIVIACHCLTKSTFRLQAQKIHGTIEGLKQTIAYSLSGDLIRQRQAYEQQTAHLQQIILERNIHIEEMQRQYQEELSAKNREIAQLTQNKPQAQTAADNQSHASSMLPVTQNTPKQRFRTPKRTEIPPNHNPNPSRKFHPVKLSWSQHRQPSPDISRSTNAVSNSTTIYFRASLSLAIHAYDIYTEQWSECPETKTKSCSLAVINDKLTTIGGYEISGPVSNQLLTLTANLQWEKQLPAMPTARARSNSVCDQFRLIVAGGETKEGDRGDRIALHTVEVLDLMTNEWSAVANLIEPFLSASITICNDRIYILGGWSGNYQEDNTPQTALSCSVTELCKSTDATNKYNIWKCIESLPVTQSTCATFKDQLLAIGGLNHNKMLSPNVYVYNDVEGKWEHNSTLSIARRLCFAVSLSNDTLLIVGGHTTPTGTSVKTKIMEVGV